MDRLVCACTVWACPLNCTCTAKQLGCMCLVRSEAGASWACSAQWLGCTCPLCSKARAGRTKAQQSSPSAGPKSKATKALWTSRCGGPGVEDPWYIWFSIAAEYISEWPAHRYQIRWHSNRSSPDLQISLSSIVPPTKNNMFCIRMEWNIKLFLFIFAIFASHFVIFG